MKPVITFIAADTRRFCRKGFITGFTILVFTGVTNPWFIGIFLVQFDFIICKEGAIPVIIKFAFLTVYGVIVTDPIGALFALVFTYDGWSFCKKSTRVLCTQFTPPDNAFYTYQLLQ